MNSVTNTKLVKRNATIGKYTNTGALVVLGLGFYLTIKMPEKMSYSLAALLVGFFLSQLGIYYGNKWGRHPRPDEIITKSLKGLSRDYTLYNYIAPVSHLLIGPAGIWTILPYHQGGAISYSKKRWRIKGGGFAQSYLRLFGQDNIGRPDLTAEAEIESAKRYLKRILPEGAEIPNVGALLLFTNPKVELDAGDSPLPAVTYQNLKDFFRAKGQENPIGTLALDTIRKALPKPDSKEE